MWDVLASGTIWLWNLLPSGVQVALGLSCKVIDKTAEIAGTFKL